MTTDFRDYLQLEAALQRKLTAAWRPLGSATMNRINDLIAEGKFDEATQAVKDIDFSAVGAYCRNSIKYILQSCIYFGASMAHGTRPGRTFCSASSHDDLLDQVVGNFLQTLSYNVTQATQEAALHSIAQAQAEPVTKAEKVRYVKDFVSFQQRGNDMLKLVSSLHSSRLSTWGFVAEASVIGFTEYELTAVLDGRTSDFCRAINGKRFRVQDAREFVNKVLKVQNPDDVKVIQPWPAQDKESIKRYAEASPEKLTEWGLHIPPFHPYCRTMCTATESVPKLQAPPVPEEDRVIPQRRSSEQDFEDMGIKVTPLQLDQWNAYMPIPPAQAAAKVSGTTAQEVVENKRKTISFADNGDIEFRIKERMNDKDFAMFLSYNPYAASFYALSSSLTGYSPTEARDFLWKVLAGIADVGQSVGAETLYVGVDGRNVRSYLDMGFSVTPAMWFDLKHDIMDHLDAGTVSIAALSAEEQQAVTDVLSSPDEYALQTLLNLPFEIDGQQIGDYLLDGESLNMRVMFSNRESMNLYRGVTS